MFCYDPSSSIFVALIESDSERGEEVGSEFWGIPCAIVHHIKIPCALSGVHEDHIRLRIKYGSLSLLGPSACDLQPTLTPGPPKIQLFSFFVLFFFCRQKAKTLEVFIIRKKRRSLDSGLYQPLDSGLVKKHILRLIYIIANDSLFTFRLILSLLQFGTQYLHTTELL